MIQFRKKTFLSSAFDSSTVLQGQSYRTAQYKEGKVGESETIEEGEEYD